MWPIVFAGVVGGFGLLLFIYAVIRMYVRPNCCPHCGEIVNQW
jgi:nitrate reductase NapE component